jgi:hypothetical protein
MLGDGRKMSSRKTERSKGSEPSMKVVSEVQSSIAV